jgi:hypothetical protein
MLKNFLEILGYKMCRTVCSVLLQMKELRINLEMFRCWLQNSNYGGD